MAAACPAAFLAFGFPSQVPAQGITFELRAGVTRSTALAEDAVANTELQQLLGSAFTGGVTATPSTGPTLAASVLVPLRARTQLDASFGWTFSKLNAEDASGSRSLQDLGIAQLALGIRYALGRAIHASCGFGAARYSADESGLFATGSELAPFMECGTGASLNAGGQRFVVHAFGQAQRFRTPALRDAGAQTGSVFRFGAQAGIVLGASR